MRKNWKKIVATIVSITLVISVPIASRVMTQVKADTYELVWSDEFDGTSLSASNWTAEIGNGNWGWGNNEKEYYTNSQKNIEVSDGTLKIKALKEDMGNCHYTSARIKTQGKHYFKYGKIEAKMKLPRFNGVWPAFWTLGENINKVGWPACGEMDIMEAINNNDKVFSNLHWSFNGNQADTQGRQYTINDRTQWHTYGMEWDENRARFYVDDIYYQTFSITDDAQMEEFRNNQFIILNLAIGGNLPGNNIDDTAFPDRSVMEVDYVRVYQQTGETTTKYDGPTKEWTEDSVEEYKGTWNSFFGTDWLGSSGELFAKEKNADGYALRVDSCGTDGHVDSAWSVQGNLEGINYIPGSTYTYKCTIESSVDKKVYVKVADGDEAEMGGEVVQLYANQPRDIQLTVDIPNDFDSIVSLKFGWGKMKGESIADNSPFTASVKNVSFKTTTFVPDTTVPVSTKPVTTTKKVSPTKKKTTVKVGKAKIKKVTRKKRSLKLKLKKIKGATGYQIRYSDSKKFDGYWEKNTRKLKVKLKKLDRKTKYYIKARAYKKHGNVYIFGKFSKRKKVKTK